MSGIAAPTRLVVTNIVNSSCAWLNRLNLVINSNFKFTDQVWRARAASSIYYSYLSIAPCKCIALWGLRNLTAHKTILISNTTQSFKYTLINITLQVQQ